MTLARPAFSEITSYAEFTKYSWYFDELVRICKEQGIACSGTKNELNRAIEAYLPVHDLYNQG